jgi:signal transduction histidine kinase/HAMP domain-containing protein
VLLLALAVVGIVALGYLGVNSVQNTGETARKVSARALETQAQEYLRQVTVGDVQRSDLVLNGVERDAKMVADFAGRVFGNAESFAEQGYWRAEDRMFVASGGQYMNSEDDVSSAFVPAYVEVNEDTQRALELGAYLDLVFAPAFEGDPNTVAIYLGTEHETTQYHPNIGLGNLVPPDFTVTERPWYVSATPENNPDREVVWSSVYVDATGKGLMVTAAAPVYAREAFVGAVGLDVTLEDIGASVQETRLLGSGYGFLIDEQGQAIALPEEGYQDILGREPESGEVGAELGESDSAFTPVLQDMMAGGEGLATLQVGGRDLYVAYAPLSATGWSLANVVEAQSVLQALASLETELERSTRSMVLARLLPFGGVVLIALAAAGFFIARRVTRPIQEIAEVAGRIGSGEWDVSLPRPDTREMGALTDAFERMAAELQRAYAELEEQVAERTEALRRRTIQLEASSQVAREAAAIRDVDDLLNETVDLIFDRFGYYHAGIFLVDEAGEYAILRAASSAGGKRMLSAQHRLRVGDEGIVGHVAGSGGSRIALDVGSDAVFFDNPDLPRTRSEIALPLKVYDEVIGVLDVQSTEEAAFTEEDAGVLQTMADQLALAIENARLLEEADARVREIRLLLREESREGWRRIIQRRPEWGYAYDGVDVLPRQTVRPRDDAQLKLPIEIRGESVGELELAWAERAPSREERSLARSIVEEAGQALESARLFEEARTRAEEQSALSDLAQELAAQLEVGEVLRTAHRGASRLVDAESFYVGLYEPEQERIVIRLNATSAAADQEVTVLPADRGLSGYVVRTGEPVLIEGNFRERLADYGAELIGEPAESWLGVPLIVGDQVLGLMAVQSYHTRAAYDDHDLGLLRAVASQTAIALESARLYEEAVETAERLREVDRLKSQFLANMSHELRTPLNSIIGFSRVVLKGIDGPVTDRQREDLEAIHNSGQHLLGLINDILDVSKIEAGKMELSFESVDLDEIIQGVMSTAVALVKDKPVDLQQSIPDDLPSVVADERRVRQVLLNLVSNAAKFTEEGSIRVSARADEDEVVVSVADTGSGIAPEELDEIFEPFTQVDASTTREHGGTGLGLTISHSFVQLHGGRMWVESELGVGSTFSFSLPLEGPSTESDEVEEVEGEAVPDLPEARSGEDQAPLVMSIDDDPSVLNLYRRYLDGHGYRVYGLTDPSRAVEIARKLRPCVITLDVLMPEMDGWAVMEELQRDPLTSEIPVVICSIVGEEERGKDEGASAYLVKPIIEEDLVAALDRLNGAAQ